MCDGHWGSALAYFHHFGIHPCRRRLLAAQNEIRKAQASEEVRPRSQFIERELDILGRRYHSLSHAGARTMRTRCAISRRKTKTMLKLRCFMRLPCWRMHLPRTRLMPGRNRRPTCLNPWIVDYPQHPGIPHYLIHAYDNAELAPRGLTAARAYTRIAPSAPHALHMPSHIFTRLGFWDDSITSNLAAREAAHQQGDTGEELHAMDYLVYAYLQSGRDQDALRSFSN